MTTTSFLTVMGLVFIAVAIMVWLAISEWKKPKIYEVCIHDKYYDHITDNDDLEDIPTLINVTYNDRGEILEVSLAVSKFTNGYLGLGCYESSVAKLQHFYQTCKIDPMGGLDEYKKYTIYNRPI